MKTTRREVLRRTAGAFMAGVAAAGGKSRKWDEDRLGVMCILGLQEAAARSVLAAARAAGFRRIQINFGWGKASSGFLTALPSWVKEEGLRVEVLSAYVNCCQPEAIMHDCSLADFARAIDYASSLGCSHLAAWSGGYSANALQQADPRNFTPEASAAVRRFLESQAPALEKAGLTLAVETFVTMACPDAPSMRAMLKGLPKCFGVVFDPPNMTPLARFEQRDEVLREMTRLLKDRVGVVHLKDFTLPPGANRYVMPRAMAGDMNYPLFVKQILALPDSTPLVTEHCKPEEFAEVRRKLLPVFAAAAG